MDRDYATCRCQRCGELWLVLADEQGDHPCPMCGWYLGQAWEAEEEADEDEEDADGR